MLNPIVNTIAINNGLIGLSLGFISAVPAVMSFASYPNTKPSMFLIGVSGLSVIPVTVIATTMSLITDDLGYQSLYMLPVIGLGIGVITDGITDLSESLMNQPVVGQPTSQFL